MPFVQVHTSRKLSPDARRTLGFELAKAYGDHMLTNHRIVNVGFVWYAAGDLARYDALDDAPREMTIVTCDVRSGRSPEVLEDLGRALTMTCAIGLDIEEARIATKVRAGASDNVKIPVDSFQSACMQACPNEAIVFGDITEPTSKVSVLRGSPRGYRLLEYLNTSPRVLYLAKLRNPNPKMPGAEKLTAFEREEKKGGASPLTTGAGDASGGPK